MFDNLCKFLAESFPEDYATWLLGSPIKLTQLSPTELSLEPIRADSLILEQSEDLVLHLEFQSKPDENMGFRMLDYRVRVYRRFPKKTMHQFVIYLKPTNSSLVYQDRFQVGETTHHYRVIRLWEESPEIFLKIPGLLPLAVLTQAEDPTLRLREVASILDTITDQRIKANLTAATSVLGGLVLKPELIKTILRGEIMKESAVYQEILQEGMAKGEQLGLKKGEQLGLKKGEQLGLKKGEQLGLKKGKVEIAQQLLNRGMALEEVVSLTGLSEQELTQNLSN
jgi:predicted transposase/invertase (TIGR01784 family)